MDTWPLTGESTPPTRTSAGTQSHALATRTAHRSHKSAPAAADSAPTFHHPGQKNTENLLPWAPTWTVIATHLMTDEKPTHKDTRPPHTRRPTMGPHW